MNRVNFLLLIGLVCSLNACISNKKLRYFQDLDTFTPQTIVTQPDEYIIKERDILSIRVISTSEEAANPFNIQQAGAQVGLGNAEAAQYINGYTVDKEGNIYIPGGIGTIRVQGLTLDETKDRIAEEVSKFLKDASVLVRLVNFRVAILGEVLRPGSYTVFNERLTLLQGLSLAGDMAELANRKSIRLLREDGDEVKVVKLDLTDRRVIMSEYFYLKPNDVVIVDPLKARSRRSNLPLLGTLFSALSTTVLLINFIND